MRPISPGRAWYAVFVLMLTFALSILDRTIINLMVGPIEADFGISDTQMGLLQGFALAVFFALAGLPLGRVADLSSRRRLIAIGITVWSFATAFSGFAQRFLHLFLARMAVGVGEATVNPAGYSMLPDMLPKDRLARAVAVFSSGSLVGAGIAFFGGGLLIHFLGARPAVELPFVGEVRSWQFIFFVVGFPGLLVAGLMMTVTEPPRQGAARIHVPMRAIVGFITEARKPFFLVTIAYSVLSMILSGTMAWVPTLLVRKHHLAPASVGGVMGLAVGVFGTVGFILGGTLCDHLVKKGYADSYMRIGAFAAAVSLPFAIAAMMSHSLSVAVPCVFTLLFAITVGMAPGVTGLTLMTPFRLRGQVSALFTLLVNLVGLSLGSLIVGVLNDYVFKSKGALDRSLLCLYAGFLPVMCGAFWLARKPVAARIALQDVARRDF